MLGILAYRFVRPTPPRSDFVSGDGADFSRRDEREE